MHPIVCSIGPFTVYSYGLMLALAFFLGQHLVVAEAKKQGLSPEIVFNFLFFSVIYGIIGARIFYVAENLKDYLSNPLEIIMLQHGGLSWFGGLILGAFCGIGYLKKKKVPVYRALDVVAPFLALAQAIGRIGCFLNGCCYGIPAPKWLGIAVKFSYGSTTRIPTQILSALALFVIFLILRIWQDRGRFRGEIFLAYGLLYSLKRFFMEFLRADNTRMILNLSLSQVISVIIFMVCLIIFRYRMVQWRGKHSISK